MCPSVAPPHLHFESGTEDGDPQQAAGQPGPGETTEEEEKKVPSA